MLRWFSNEFKESSPGVYSKKKSRFFVFSSKRGPIAYSSQKYHLLRGSKQIEQNIVESEHWIAVAKCLLEFVSWAGGTHWLHNKVLGG
jgi:hypothetical protein